MAIKYFTPGNEVSYQDREAQEKCKHTDLELISAQLVQEKPKILASVNYKCKACGLSVQTDGTEKVDNLDAIRKIAKP